MDSEGIKRRAGRSPPILGASRGWAPGGTESDDEHDVDASIPSTPFEQGFEHLDGIHSEDVSTTRPPESPVEHGIGSDHNPEQDEHEDEDDRQCRICFGGAEEEDVLGRLISPCLCTGSVRVSWHDHSPVQKADDSMSIVSYPMHQPSLRCSEMHQRMARDRHKRGECFPL
jgi:hypothetical protein